MDPYFSKGHSFLPRPKATTKPSGQKQRYQTDRLASNSSTELSWHWCWDEIFSDDESLIEEMIVSAVHMSRGKWWQRALRNKSLNSAGGSANSRRVWVRALDLWQRGGTSSVSGLEQCVRHWVSWELWGNRAQEEDIGERKNRWLDQSHSQREDRWRKRLVKVGFNGGCSKQRDYFLSRVCLSFLFGHSPGSPGHSLWYGKTNKLSLGLISNVPLRRI